ncbi:1043_t:CDS:2 [Ambispora gerdemannii]|uniref:1043_t:CDS:1 n=1 Tax=Ambispora gerdemannii TaxID=144530 RepID=A0A9N9DDX2_9GLOM|nr:1043_t:CDS:2 [Ambispora gerdemannii]
MTSIRAHGQMDKAPDYESGDSRQKNIYQYATPQKNIYQYTTPQKNM